MVSVRSEKQLLFFWLLLAVPLFGQESLLDRGKEAFERNDFPAAVDLLGRVPEGPDHCQATYYLGLSLYRVHKLSDSIVALQSAVTCSPNSAPAGLALAKAWLDRGDDNYASRALEAALKADPANIDALRVLSWIYLRHEMNDKAEEVLRRLVQQVPSDPQAHADLGAALAGSVNYAAAREEFEKALALQADHPGASAGLANVLLKTEQPEAALKFLNQSIEQNESSYETHYLRGTALNNLGRYQEAISDFQSALKLGGQDPDVLFQLSRAYRSAGQEERSREVLDRFSALRSQSHATEEARRDAARLVDEAAPLVEKGALPEAAVLLRKASELDPLNPHVLFRLAGIEYDTKNYPAARTTIQRALELAPSEWLYYFLLGLIELDTAHVDAANVSLQKAARLNPTAAEVYSALGDVAMTRHDAQESMRAYQRAVDLKPTESNYRQKLEAAKKAALIR